MDAARIKKKQVFPEENRMVMQNSAGEDRGRSPKANHPWNHPQRRLNAMENSSAAPKTCKLTMAVTLSEFKAFRSQARRLGKSSSELMRDHFPAELLLPPSEDN
jgi:hypothetical protein